MSVNSNINENDLLNGRFRIKPHFSVVHHDPNIIEFRHGVWHSFSVTYVDKSHSNILGKVVELLEGNNTTQEVVSQIGNERKDEIIEMMRKLIAEGILESASQPDMLEYYTRVMFGASLERPSSKGRTRVAAITSDITERVKRSLSDDMEFSYLPESFTDKLTSVNLVQEDPVAFGTVVDQLSSHLQDVDLMLVAPTTLNPLFLRNLNRLTLETKVKWMFASIDGPFVIVGPTFMPPETPCFECFELRVGLNLRNFEGYYKYKRALADGKVKVGRLPVPSAILDLVAATVSVEMLSLCATGSCSTVGKALTLYIPTMEFAYHEVLRLPVCPACNLGKNMGSSLYFDVRDYVNVTLGGKVSKETSR